MKTILISLGDFLNSSFFIACTTIVTAIVAWWVYRTQKKNEKIQAARVLITEIRIAEERLAQIRSKMNENQLSDLPPVFPTKSWKKYSHLFISDFDQDELKTLNSFYDYGERVEEHGKRDNDFFWVTSEERARITVQKSAEFVIEALNLPPTDQDDYIRNKKDLFSALMDKHAVLYSPMKTINVIKAILPNIPTVTTSTCGAKLKNLANL